MRPRDKMRNGHTIPIIICAPVPISAGFSEFMYIASIIPIPTANDMITVINITNDNNRSMFVVTVSFDLVPKYTPTIVNSITIKATDIHPTV